MDLETFMEEYFGKCVACKYLNIWQEDPSGGKGNLGRGTVTHCECRKDVHKDVREELVVGEIMKTELDEYCPFFVSKLKYCDKDGHGYYINGFCPACEQEVEKLMEKEKHKVGG